MTTPASGAISIIDIVTEFGGTAPHSLSEYYGVASGVPSSGTISLSDFYNKSASTPVSVTFNAAYNSEPNLSTYSFTIAAGTATSDRLVVIQACGFGNNGVSAMTGCTINGTSATSAGYTTSSEASTDSQYGMYYLNVPTGTTVDVVVTFTGSQDRFGAACYSVYNSSGVYATATDNVDSSGVLEASVAVPDNGAIIGLVGNRDATATYTWTGLTEDYEYNGGDSNISTFTGASATYSTGTTQNVTCSMSDSTPDRYGMVLTSFSPA